ncbi:hypothetical protein Tco_1040760 [Tanacetum coccineum]
MNEGFRFGRLIASNCEGFIKTTKSIYIVAKWIKAVDCYLDDATCSCDDDAKVEIVTNEKDNGDKKNWLSSTHLWNTNENLEIMEEKDERRAVLSPKSRSHHNNRHLGSKRDSLFRNKGIRRNHQESSSNSHGNIDCVNSITEGKFSVSLICETATLVMT